MPKRLELFAPGQHSTPESELCNFHIRGCCFDPKKTVNGFIAAPCFNCKNMTAELKEHFE